MDITHVKEGKISIITINGRLDAATAPVADKTIKNILEGDCLRMLFDFSALDYLSSGGLKVILGATKELRRKGGQIVLCSLPNLVREIFDVSGLNSLIPITDTVESGIEHLGQPFTNSGVQALVGLRPSGFRLRYSSYDGTSRSTNKVQPLTA
jgi:anti-anti-sigma factor